MRPACIQINARTCLDDGLAEGVGGAVGVAVGEEHGRAALLVARGLRQWGTECAAKAGQGGGAGPWTVTAPPYTPARTCRSSCATMERRWRLLTSYEAGLSGPHERQEPARAVSQEGGGMNRRHTPRRRGQPRTRARCRTQRPRAPRARA